MALFPVSGRVGYPSSPTQTARPVEAGAVTYTRPSGGTDSLGAVTVAGRVSASITGGQVSTVYLAPGQWEAHVDPRNGDAFTFPLAVEDGPVDLATAQPIIVSGQKFAKGDRGDPGPPSTVPGPANTLTIGTVTTGPAAATVTGQAPAQTLNLTIPEGPAPSVAWSGDRLTVGGQTGPALTGPASTVPGPTGKTAYQYAKDAGYKGTEEEFAQATVPTSVSWANLSDKPATFPPSAHTHTIANVTGLQAAIDAKAATTDPRFTDARTPLAHTHTQADVTGLVAALAALSDRITVTERDTGWVTTGFTPNTTAGWSIPSAGTGGWSPFRLRIIGKVMYINGTLAKSSGGFAVGDKVGTFDTGYRTATYHEYPRGAVNSAGEMFVREAGSIAAAFSFAVPLA